VRRSAGIPGVTGTELRQRFESIGLSCGQATTQVAGTRFDCKDPAQPDVVTAFISVNDAGRVWAGGGSILGPADLDAEARRWFPPLASAIGSGGPDQAAIADWMRSAVGQDGSTILGDAFWQITSRAHTIFFSVEASDLPGHGPVRPLSPQRDPQDTQSPTPSSGQSEVTVPDVAGLSPSDATNQLGRIGLETTVVDEPSDLTPEGLVTRSAPPASSRIPAGSRVTIYVSTGPTRSSVPTVLGLTASDATARLQAAGLVVQRASRATSTADEDGLVVDQTPDGGTEAPAGSTVTIVVARFTADSSTTTTAGG
jgi:serine/threonine-protein kinase